MRATRKALEAQNTQLRAQLAVHDHVTRKGLNEFVRGLQEKNKALEATVKKQADAVESLKADLVLAKTEKSEAVAA